MGKSPGKWMKTLIFGKKSSRSKNTKPYDEKRRDVKDEPVSVDQIGKTDPSLSVSQSNEEKIEDNLQSCNPQDDAITPVLPDKALSAAPELYAQNDSDTDRLREEQAALDLQAAVRGYLARREFWTLKGIIRLQALIRGHLVRRQAISTLYCMFQIVKCQAVARGINIRHSDIGVQVQNKYTRVNHRVIGSVGANKYLDILKRSRNGFACKIVASSPTAMPLHFQYDPNESNSVLRWLERWSTSRCWQLLPKPNAGQQLKVKKPYTHTRKPSVTNVESIASEFDKPTRILRKVSYIEPANIIEDNPELVLERVKRSLRKVNNPVLSTTVLTETETEKITNDNTRKIIKEPEPEKVSVTKVETAVIKVSDKEDETINEMKKSGRRVSAPAKQGVLENNEQKPKIKRSMPSYMASTVSAKAKLRGQDSPESPTTITRRYSLPSLKNANTSLSPRVQSTGRLKNDRSLQLSRDSNGSVKVYKAEWRR